MINQWLLIGKWSLGSIVNHFRPIKTVYSFKNVWVRAIHLNVKSMMLTASQVRAALFKITHVKKGPRYGSHMFSKHVCDIISCAAHTSSFRNLFQHNLSSVGIKYTHIKQIHILTHLHIFWHFIKVISSVLIMVIYLNLSNSGPNFFIILGNTLHLKTFSHVGWKYGMNIFFLWSKKTFAVQLTMCIKRPVLLLLDHFHRHINLKCFE